MAAGQLTRRKERRWSGDIHRNKNPNKQTKTKNRCFSMGKLNKEPSHSHVKLKKTAVRTCFFGK